MTEATRIADSVEHEQSKPAEQLLPLVYEELRRLAAHKMARQPAGQTLQATALVHEAYLRLMGDRPAGWNSPGHFFSCAAEARRRILIERARKKSAIRHGGRLQKITLAEVNLAAEMQGDLLLLLNEALEEFQHKDPAAAELVKLRFFVGFSNAQAAELLGISERTAKRSWAYARAWLYNRIRTELASG